MAITNTNQRPGNEVWMFDILRRLEDDGHLAAFCGHAGIAIADGATAEVIWIAIKAHYTLADGTLDAATACRDLLAFPPYMEAMADEIANARSHRS